MNFFRSILADEPDPPETEDATDSAAESTLHTQESDESNGAVDRSENAWSFGGLLKNLAARSESVIETYRKDLEEFGSGLKKETEIIRVVASRAVKDLPVSLEAGASAAHGVLDGVLKSTAEIISREAQLLGSDGETENPGTNSGVNAGRYSRFDAQLSALQSDFSTYSEDPDDVEEFKNWRLKFQLDEKKDEIDYLVVESGTLDGVYKKLVPSVVDGETFWCRYFYRVDKLKQQEKIRENLVKRAISGEDDDELSWDVDDEEDSHGIKQETVLRPKTDGEDGDIAAVNAKSNLDEKQSRSNEELVEVKQEAVTNLERNEKDGNTGESNEKLHKEKEGTAVVKSKTVIADEIAGSGNSLDVESSKVNDDVKNESHVDVPHDQKEDESNIKKGVAEEVLKNENIEALNVKSTAKDDSSHRPKEETDDLSWDEIEDVASDDEKKNSAGSHGITADRAVLRKQLNSTEDDEDLSWDIEDDDEPSKS